MTILFQSCQYVFVTTRYHQNHSFQAFLNGTPGPRGHPEDILPAMVLVLSPDTDQVTNSKKKKKNFWQANSCQSADRTGNTSITTVTLPAAWENAASWRRASALLPPDRRRHTSATRSPGQRPPRPRWPALCSRRSRSLTRPGNASFPFLPSRFYPLAKPPFKQPLKWNCHYSRPFIFLTLIAFIFHYVNYNI